MFTKLPQEVITQLVQFKYNSEREGVLFLKALYLLFPEEKSTMAYKCKWIIT